MADLNPSPEYWKARCDKLQRERDDLRVHLDRLATEGAAEGRRRGREDGRQCAESMNLTLTPESHLQLAEEGVKFAWWKLGFTEGAREVIHRRLDFDPNQPTTEPRPWLTA